MKWLIWLYVTGTSRRSRSAPAPSITTRLESQMSSLPPSPQLHHTWREAHVDDVEQGDFIEDGTLFPEVQEQIEITLYDMEDVERIQRRRKEDVEVIYHFFQQYFCFY